MKDLCSLVWHLADVVLILLYVATLDLRALYLLGALGALGLVWSIYFFALRPPVCE